MIRLNTEVDTKIKISKRRPEQVDSCVFGRSVLIKGSINEQEISSRTAITKGRVQ